MALTGRHLARQLVRLHGPRGHPRAAMRRGGSNGRIFDNPEQNR
jgi:hypothetical protein